MNLATPHIQLQNRHVRLCHEWTLSGLGKQSAALRQQLTNLSADLQWDLSAVEKLDSFGAVLLWHAWGKRWPTQIQINAVQRNTIDSIAHIDADALPRASSNTLIDYIAMLGDVVPNAFHHGRDLLTLTGQIFLNLLHLLRAPREWPLKEISANIYKMGIRAMPIAALVGFLIGVVLSYLSALQLQMFGADIFIVNILGLGIIRELGPVLVSVLVAGRSGSAITAQLGVMRVTEEIDALSAMGISHTLRLVLPKILAMAITMPLLVLWTSAAALIGGMLAAWIQMDLGMLYFMQALPDAVPLPNLYIALAKGFAFGVLIALLGSHFGLRVKPNTESLSANTTASVVSAITGVILLDALFAIATRSIGVP